MATVQISATLNDTTIGLKRTASDTVTTTGTSIDYRVVALANNTEKEITISADIGNVGYAFLKNLDTTNPVSVGVATGVYPIVLPASGFALVPLAAATASIFALNAAAASDLEVYFHEA